MTGKLIVNKTCAKDSRMPRFSVESLVVVMAVAYELAGRPFSEPLTGMDEADFDAAILIPLMSEWEDVINQVIRAKTKIDVRFLGDLKEHTYDPDVIFFSATKDDGADFSELLRKSMSSARSSGHNRAVLVNLANVREISVDMGNDVSASFLKKLEDTMDVIKVIRAWSEAGHRLTVETP